jgi:His-Xaa-Ser system protein HxsD
MKLEKDLKERSVTFKVDARNYSLDSARIAAHVFSARAEVFFEEAKGALELTLQAKRKSAGAAELDALAGEFLNEMLNQEYRFLVSRFNERIASLTITQSLFAARGGENPPGPAAGEASPEFQAAVAAMLAEAQEEISRTMPKRLPPQGTPLPPPKSEDALA